MYSQTSSIVFLVRILSHTNQTIDTMIKRILNLAREIAVLFSRMVFENFL